MRLTALACVLVAIAACDSRSPDPSAAEPPAASSHAPPPASAAPADEAASDLPVTVDFEEAAEAEIDASSYRAVADAIERELDGD